MPNDFMNEAYQGDLGPDNFQDAPETEAPEQKSGVRRELGEVVEDRIELVKKRTESIKADRKFWDKDFKRMRHDMDFVMGKQYAGQTSIDDDDRYIANITQRHVQQRTAAIYAKNPTVVARRKEMMDFVIWDENPLTAQMALKAVSMQGQLMAGVQSGDPNAIAQAQSVTPQMMQEAQLAQALLDDIQQGMQARASSKRLSKTMEIYFKNKVLSQQYPPFKMGMKQLVRRAMACGIGYLKLGLVREMEMSPDVLKGMATMQETMATVEAMMARFIDNPEVMAACSAEKEELRLAMDAMQKQPLAVTQEGIFFDFPSSTSIIPDRNLVHLQGFVGCDVVTEEFMFPVDVIEKIWKVDVSEGCTRYSPAGVPTPANGSSPSVSTPGEKVDGLACVWISYDRTTGLTYTLCDGYKDFLEEPCPPKITLERFFPWFVLGFNWLEHHEQRFPLSDVHLLRHPQREYNRASEARREHRIANRPMTAVPRGLLDDDDVQKLQDRPANGVVQVGALAPGQKIDDVLQAVKHPPMDPQVYETEHNFADVLRVVGSQEANLGGTSNSTATESSIAESSRMSSLQSNMDDMDDLLTEAMRSAGQVALMEISAAEVMKVCGRGAVWPTLSKQEVAEEIFLEIEAGSSGRPNKAVEVQNMTQTMPFLLQIPGLNPEWILRQLITRLDDRLDLTDAFLSNQPSIQTLNALAAKPLGQSGGAADPNAQGAEGGQNAPEGADAGGALGPQAANAGPPPAMSAAPVA